MIFIPIILFLIPLCLKLKDNLEKWKINATVYHGKEFISVAVAEMPAAILFCVFSDSWWSLIVVPLVMMFWFWFLFDGFYNLLRRWWRKKMNMIYSHLTWWYTGTNDKNDAKSDNFLQRLKLWQHIFVKVGAIAITTILYVLIYKK
jgi:hypothetical protein